MQRGLTLIHCALCFLLVCFWSHCCVVLRAHLLQKKLVEAEKYLKQALHEAKLGFGETDPHVAGAFNNLAELHRLKQEMPEAEALYQQVSYVLHIGQYSILGIYML